MRPPRGGLTVLQSAMTEENSHSERSGTGAKSRQPRPDDNAWQRDAGARGSQRGVTQVIGNWDTEAIAASYADFCRRFPSMRRPVTISPELLPVATAGFVVDLACGTGTTTEVILPGLPAHGRVWRSTRRRQCSTRHLGL